jgi:translocation and assembly module TamB
LLVAGAVMFIDSGAGHRLIVDKIAGLALKNGLKIRIGRIEGSIFGQARLRDLRLYDDRGLFLSSPVVELDWNPTAYLYNELWIDSLEADLVTLVRLPTFRPAETKGPLLPEFDIHIGRLDIKRLAIGAAVTGRPRAGRVAGSADIRSGRALVDLKALVADGGDVLALKLDAQPDANRFDVDLRVVAPAGGVAGAIVGTPRPFQLQVAGDGLWTDWRGRGLLDVSGKRVANLALNAKRGQYSIEGLVSPEPFLTGRLAALAAPRISVAGTGTFRERVLDGRLSLRSAALRAEARGGVDLASSSFRRVAVALDVLDPKVLLPALRAEKLRATVLLDGAFARARYAYRITAARAQIDATGLDDVRIEGRGQLSREPIAVPIDFRARQVTGVGVEAGGLLQNLRIQGLLRLSSGTLAAQNLRLTSDKLAGRLTLLFNFASGRYDIALSGSIGRYQIPASASSTCRAK